MTGNGDERGRGARADIDVHLPTVFGAGAASADGRRGEAPPVRPPVAVAGAGAGAPCLGAPVRRGRGRRGARRWRVEAANHFGGEVETRIGPDDSRVERAEQDLELLLLRDLLNDRTQLLLEFGLQLVLQFLRRPSVRRR